MNDDGSNQHPLVTTAQVPGMSSIGEPNVFPNGGTSVAFEATTLQYLQLNNGPAGACGINCEGLYTLVNGAVTRLTAAAAPCGVGQQWCAVFSTNPYWMASGNLAYEFSAYTWYYSCSQLPCYWAFNPGSIDQINVVPPVAGAGTGTKFAMQHFEQDGTPDPADATKVAYVGTAQCSPTCQIPLYTSTGTGTDTPVVYDDNLIQAAWSPDGQRFADVEGGDTRGIWTYASNAASTPGKAFVDALVDPIQTGHDPGANPYDVTFSHVAWAGTSTIVFVANGNLWSIPASCNLCQFPRDATQLTTDGNSTSADTDPSWTSATTAVTPVPPATPPASGGGVQGTGTQQQGATAGTSSVARTSVSGNAASVSLACAGTAATCQLAVQLVVVETLQGSKIVAVKASKPKRKARTVVVGGGTATLSGGQTQVLKVSLNGTGKSLLSRFHTLHVGMTVTQAVGASTRVVKTGTLTFTLPRKRRK